MRDIFVVSLRKENFKNGIIKSICRGFKRRKARKERTPDESLYFGDFSPVSCSEHLGNNFIKTLNKL